MEFITKCTCLKHKYNDNVFVRKNGTMLLGPGRIPKAKHYLYSGISSQFIQNKLLDCYMLKIPEDYISFLKYSNGANLFNVRVQTDTGVEFAISLLTVFGLPLKPPYSRDDMEEEPFDIAIEDLRRHPKTPSHWLKFGSYYHANDIQNDPLDLFVDTNDCTVYSCRQAQGIVETQWSSIDLCLCSLFDEFSKLDLDNPLYFCMPDSFVLVAKGEYFGGDEVDDFIEKLLEDIPESMGKTKRLKEAQKRLKEAFHIVGRRYPQWVQAPAWPMGTKSPMSYVHSKKTGNMVVYEFQDVDSGELRKIKQLF